MNSFASGKFWIFVPTSSTAFISIFFKKVIYQISPPKKSTVILNDYSGYNVTKSRTDMLLTNAVAIEIRE